MAFNFIAVVPLVIIFSIFIALVLALNYVRKISSSANEEEETTLTESDEAINDTRVDTATATTTDRQLGNRNLGTRRRRGGLSRMRRAAATTTARDEDGDDVDGSSSSSTPSMADKRQMKKEQKRQAKKEAQEAHQSRLEALREREEKMEEKRIIEAEQDRIKEEEREKKAAEKEEQQRLEYLEWKNQISLQGSGESTTDVNSKFDSDPDLLNKFIDYIKVCKIVVLEDLAAEFDLKTQDVIHRLVSLQQPNIESGESRITGFFDDRGKFIYVSMDEMIEVAEFIKGQGRISIQQLAYESSHLLHLDHIPIIHTTTTTNDDDDDDDDDATSIEQPVAVTV